MIDRRCSTPPGRRRSAAMAERKLLGVQVWYVIFIYSQGCTLGYDIGRRWRPFAVT